MNILYISYDGIMEPLGESQVLSYQSILAEEFNIILLSYEKKNALKDTKKLNDMKARVHNSSINWKYHRYHKTPTLLATFYDLFIGLIHSCFLIFKYKIKVVHARSYPPALIAIILKKIFGINFIFDMRGFWADERVDGNIWEKDSQIFKLTKSLEKSFIMNADHIVSLTHTAVKEIKKFDYTRNIDLNFSVISTCVDIEKFSKFALNRNNDKVFNFGYLGTVGTWYLFDETVKAFKISLSIIPSAKFLIINNGEHGLINSKLTKYKVPLSSVRIVSADHSEVPALLNEVSASIFFLKPVFSKQASAPTKLGEFLACGIPCLTNDGVGDMGEIIKKSNVGVAISEFDDASVQTAVKSLIDLSQEKGIKERCINAARKNFSLIDGSIQYSKIYYDLLRKNA